MGFFSIFCELLYGVLDSVANAFPEFAQTPIYGGLVDIVDAICGPQEAA